MATFVVLKWGALLASTICFASGYLASQQLLSKVVSEFDGIVIEKYFRQKVNGSAPYCQLLCLYDDECMSYFHNRYTDICQTHGVVFFNSSDGQLSPGSQYYRPIQDFCPSKLGYIYNRALHLCYKFHYLNPGDYDHATKMCQNESGKLVITDTKEKYDHIGWTIKASTYPSNPWPGFLIGAREGTKTDKRNWIWHDGQYVDESIWNWCPGEPSDNAWVEPSVVMIESTDNPPVCMNDVAFDPKHFVCELQI